MFPRWLPTAVLLGAVLNGAIASADEAQRQELIALNAELPKLNAARQNAAGIDTARRVLELNQSLYGAQTAGVANAHYWLGHFLAASQRPAEAKPEFERARALRRELLGPKHADTLTVTDRLAAVLQTLKDFAAAQTLHEETLAARRETLGDRHADTIASLDRLGESLVAALKLPAAQPYYEEALAARQATLGPKHLAVAQSEHKLGQLLKDCGEYGAAKPHFERALAIREELSGPKDAAVAHSLLGLGDTHDLLGDRTTALACFERALAIQTETLGPRHPATAGSHAFLGNLLRRQGERERALRHYEESLAINREVYGEKSGATATALNNLGMAYQSLGDLAKARDYLQQSVTLKREVLGPTDPFTAATMNSLGNVLRRLGDYPGARPLMEDALAIREVTPGPQHPCVTESLLNLTHLEAAVGDWARAGERQRAGRLSARTRVTSILPALDPKEQLQFINVVDRPNFWAALSLGLHQDQHPPLAALSAEFLANGKSAIEESLADRAALALVSADPAVKSVVEELAATRARLAKLAQGSPAASEAAKFREDFVATERRERELAAQVNQRLGRAANANPWTSLADVRRGMAPRAVLVDIARLQPFVFNAPHGQPESLPPRYLAWVVPAAGEGEPRVVDLGSADAIDEAVAAFQTALRPCQDPDPARNPLLARGEAAAERELQTALAAVSKLVLDPLLPHLRDKDELILSPDAALWLVPWAALPAPDDATKYAIERWTIRYVISARDLAGDRGPVSQNPPRILADPDFDLTADQIAPALAQVLGPQSVAPSPATNSLAVNEFRTRSADVIGRADRLPGSSVEAAAITPHLKRFTNAEPKTYASRLALEGIFKKLRAPRVLVLSTHGFFFPAERQSQNEVENPLLRCGLLLAGCNDRARIPLDSPLDDGVLTGMEIVGADLRGTELVVLSACETGVGHVVDGQGVAGLRQAFQLAGARTVVATLWRIPDAPTARLMDDFFAALAEGKSKPAALRAAQLASIKSRREKFSAAHPFYWAAFTATGATSAAGR